jgi:hypothetical protein
LVEQITIGAVRFDAVESSGLGVFGRSLKLTDNAWQLMQLKHPRRHDLDLAIVGERFARDFKRRRSNRQRAVVKVRVRYASDVPELSENRAAGLVNGVGEARALPILARSSDAELAAVSNYVIGRFGGQTGRVSAEKLRQGRSNQP